MTAPQPASRPKLIIDCDPGHDDALAIMVAAQHADLVAITTVSGNAALADTTRNALGLVELLGLKTPVHAGAARPLFEPPRHGTHIHGEGGLGGPPPLAPRTSPASDDAVGYIIDTVRAGPDGEIWLVPVGPMTNIATAFAKAPDLVARVAGVSFMGGSATAGNVTAAAEFNVWADPEAAAQVLAASAEDVRMAGLDLTRQFCVDDEFLQRLAPLVAAGHAPAAFCDQMLGFYLDRQQAASGRRRGPAHDVCAVLAVTHDLIDFAVQPVAVELAGTLTRGMTVVDRRSPATAGWPPVAVGHTIDATAATEVLLDAIAMAGQR